MLTASIGDLRAMRRLGRNRVALMEHGAGQSYGGDRASASAPSYAGGAHREAELFLHPNAHAAGRDRKAYPKARVEIVGSPFLDTMPRRLERRATDAPVVAITWHFDANVCAESGPAWPHFRAAALALREHYTVLGTAHPRILASVAPWYRRAGIEIVPAFDDVARRADLLVFDNTSVGFAFAASGRPVVVLNSPRYRRKIQHGLRFWDAAGVGIGVDRALDLRAAVAAALEDGPDLRAGREAALDLVYTYRTGAAKRAAVVLREWAAEPRRVLIAMPERVTVTWRS
jgi:hypothetical protein